MVWGFCPEVRWPEAGSRASDGGTKALTQTADTRTIPLVPAGWCAYRITESLEAYVSQKGCTLAQFALAWGIHQPGIASAIIGPRTHEQLEDNLGALDVDITAEVGQLADELVPPGTVVSPFYQANFGLAKFRW